MWERGRGLEGIEGMGKMRMFSLRLLFFVEDSVRGLHQRSVYFDTKNGMEMEREESGRGVEREERERVVCLKVDCEKPKNGKVDGVEGERTCRRESYRVTRGGYGSQWRDR